MALWQQSILPDMCAMAQAWVEADIPFWQRPQGVRATRTPAISNIR